MHTINIGYKIENMFVIHINFAKYKIQAKSYAQKKVFIILMQ